MHLRAEVFTLLISGLLTDWSQSHNSNIKQHNDIQEEMFEFDVEYSKMNHKCICDFN